MAAIFCFSLQVKGGPDAAGKAIQPGQRYSLLTRSYRDLTFEQRTCLAAQDERQQAGEEARPPAAPDIDGNIIRLAPTAKRS